MSEDNKKEGEGHVLGDGAGVYIPSDAPDDSPKNLEADFGGFIVGLYQSAMVSLGEMEHPETGATERDFEAAKHTIDLLKVLQIKTKGNLDQEEEQLLKGLLHRLRIAFVEAKG
ncbi:MAG: DUF1844 domain-containing protein [Myxococcota bacterium]|jgi:hypothetical protein|nr:DUF1844 domain-containing protein [Myxococcota bacterium]